MTNLISIFATIIIKMVIIDLTVKERNNAYKGMANVADKTIKKQIN